jgi:hypothetical protein
MTFPEYRDHLYRAASHRTNHIPPSQPTFTISREKKTRSPNQKPRLLLLSACTASPGADRRDRNTLTQVAVDQLFEGPEL